MTFNLVDEPWIVVRMADGAAATVGLRELFHGAHRISRIHGDLATQDFAVLRVALAIYYRAVLEEASGDYDAVDIAALWNDGPPLHAIDRYLDQWHHRFDLFHPEHPFLQVADLHLASDEVRGLELLVSGSPGEGALFSMAQRLDYLDAATAARWLIHCHAFDYTGIKSGAVGDERVKGGRGYPIGVGWAGWLGGLIVEGDNVAETLFHNFVAPKEPDDRDAPIWELSPLTSAPRRASDAGPFGPLALFTWPIRRIRLFHSDRSVTGVLVCNGDPLDYWRQHTREPMSAWRLSDAQRKKQKSTTPVYMPAAHDKSRALWRGLGRLLPWGTDAPRDKAGDRLHLPPHTLNELSRRVALGLLPEDILIRTSGVGFEYGAQMSSYGELITDALEMHPTVTDPSSASHSAVRTALDRADGAARAVGNFSADLAVAAGGEREPAMSTARDRAYHLLEQDFGRWLPTVNNTNTEERLSIWTNHARDTLIALAEELTADAPPAARGLRERDGHLVSIGTAQHRFRRNLYHYLPTESKNEGGVA
ncbi:type I-E CRISPR-associated protein Cse1/CasA [Tsukamurella sp. NPDC003166]|uniref:type I-E CRISPR-associated protein Cse1/CasA n=1 Tax=Tsukamurella sp. NPDC003166 TaxID=3154444 RepID=UPI0033B90BFA